MATANPGDEDIEDRHGDSCQRCGDELTSSLAVTNLESVIVKAVAATTTSFRSDFRQLLHEKFYQLESRIVALEKKFASLESSQTSLTDNRSSYSTEVVAVAKDLGDERRPAEPLRRFLKKPQLLHTEGLDRLILSIVTMMGTDVYVIHSHRWEIEVYATDYDLDQRQVQFLRSRKVQIKLDENRFPELMEACETSQRLYVIDSYALCGYLKANRIDPQTGKTEFSWTVDDAFTSVKAVDNGLCLTYQDRLELHDGTNGQILKRIPLDLSDSRARALAMPKSDEYYVVTSEMISVVASDGRVLERHHWDDDIGGYKTDSGLPVRGAVVDCDGSVFVLSGDKTTAGKETLRVFRPGRLDEAAHVASLNDPDYSLSAVEVGRWSSEKNWLMWLDYRRGLLFAWAMHFKLYVYRILNVD